MKKYCCFDIGNVLCEVHTGNFYAELSEVANVTISEADLFIKRFHHLHDLGHTTLSDELKDRFNIKSPIILEKLNRYWNEAVTPNIDILDRLHEFSKAYDIKIALLSNIGTEHAVLMKDKLSHGNLYSKAIKHFSCFVGARKPSSIYYQSFLLQYPEFYGCLYVDDLKENLEMGAKFNFVPFHFDLNEENFKSKFEEIERHIIDI